MPQRKHVKKVRIAPRTDANQNAREHIEKIERERRYFAKKLAELQAKREAEAEAMRMKQMSTATPTIDGLEAPPEV